MYSVVILSPPPRNRFLSRDCFSVFLLHIFFAIQKISNPRPFAIMSATCAGCGRSAGCDLPVFDKQIITRILRGLSALRPPGFDSRVALLPHLPLPSTFTHPRSVDHLLYKAAVVFGFFGMLRFSSFAKLTIPHIILVDRSGRETTLTREYASLLYSNRLAGFYFAFSSKCHSNARACYCSLKNFQAPWTTLCPVTVLQHLGINGLLFSGPLFPKSTMSSQVLGSYMTFLAQTSRIFTPHSLRIGGHTFFSVQNMHEDFVQFLGRRSINKTSQLYYRTRAADNILQLSLFFQRLTSEPVVNGRGLFGVS